MIYSCEQAVREALLGRGLGNVWWGARILEAWPHAVGLRFAEKAQPILEKSPLHERGLLTVAVPNSAWLQELSFLNIGDRMNEALGTSLVREVRFEIREVAR